ncbi:unnamed protein product [Anisakis simplex]|uniref:ANK_REP_REGION domain-containing protein n=1 Tax=Anisakis simplex TaxID=6269 RepID=A0A0M3JGQ7_ANISI|nr:unnamed protein product [Anisakis simplex]
MVAARMGRNDVARAVIYESDIDDIDYDGWTALLNAAHEGHFEVAETLINAGAAVDYPDLVVLLLLFITFIVYYCCCYLLLLLFIIIIVVFGKIVNLREYKANVESIMKQ